MIKITSIRISLKDKASSIRWIVGVDKKQAGTELCQAQSKLIQIGRFSGRIYIFVGKVVIGS